MRGVRDSTSDEGVLRLRKRQSGIELRVLAARDLVRKTGGDDRDTCRNNR